jgi:hypothetical protein
VVKQWVQVCDTLLHGHLTIFKDEVFHCTTPHHLCCCNSDIRGHCCVLHHSCTHVISDNSCVFSQTCNSIFPNHCFQTMSFNNVFTCLFLCVPGSHYWVRFGALGSSFLLMMGYKNKIHYFTEIDPCVAQQRLWYLTLDSSKKPTRAGFASISEFETSAILKRPMLWV